MKMKYLLPFCVLFLALEPPSAVAAAGDLDPDFGTGGKVESGLPISLDFFSGSAALQSDGKIVIASGGIDFSIYRFNADGTLDTSFGTNGTASTDADFGGYRDKAYAVALQADGRILAAGELNKGFGLVRYQPNGSLDTTFGNSGSVELHFGGTRNTAAAVLVQKDGKILVAGTYEDANSVPRVAMFAIARLHSDGTLDTSYDSDGMALTPMGQYGLDLVTSAALQADGKLVVAGRIYQANGEYQFALARYDTDGSLDTGFDGDGKVFTSVAPASQVVAPRGLAIQDDGKILVAGYTEDHDRSLLARYGTNGSLDASFGANGLVFQDVAENLGESFNAVALQSDGAILVSGYAGDDFSLLRYRNDGTLDPEFGINGVVMTDFLGDTDQAATLHVQADGKALVTGPYSDPEQAYIYFTGLARYQTEGAAISWPVEVSVLSGKGSVESTPAGIDCPGTCTARFGDATEVVLTAHPDPTWTESSIYWSGDCAGATGNSCDLSMAGARSAGVVFQCELIDIVPPGPVTSAAPAWQCARLKAVQGFIIEGPGGEVTFEAESSITLGPGFEIREGGIFRAIINP